MAETILALYDHLDDAQRAVVLLREEGYPQDAISMVIRDEDEVYKEYGEEPAQLDDALEGLAAGGLLGGLTGLLAGLFALVVPGLGPLIVAGPLATTLTGAGLGAVTGGLLGALLDVGVEQEEATYYVEGVRRGAVLVAATAPEGRTEDVTNILNMLDPIDLEKRVPTWRASGWAE